jgi:hypothetical protein
MTLQAVHVNLESPFEKNTLTFNVDFEDKIQSFTVLKKVAANLERTAKDLSLLASYIKSTDCSVAEIEFINQIINLAYYHIPFFYPFDEKIVSIPINRLNDRTYFATTLKNASDQLTETATRISDSARRIISEKMISMLNPINIKKTA